MTTLLAYKRLGALVSLFTGGILCSVGCGGGSDVSFVGEGTGGVSAGTGGAATGGAGGSSSSTGGSSVTGGSAGSGGSETERAVVIVTVTGDGTVSSAPAGIDCTDQCSGDFEVGGEVTLTAKPSTGHDFVGWSGGCTGSEPSCKLDVTKDVAVVAMFEPAERTVTVQVSGNGKGSVSSTPSGVDCPDSSCELKATSGSKVTLQPKAESGSTFVGWTGGGCSGLGDCELTVTDDTAVEAAFALDDSLIVTKDGNGSGTVSSAPTGIDCGNDCDQTYPPGTSVTLTAKPGTGSTFEGWSGGGCSGTGTCVVSITAALQVTATFELEQHSLKVATSGTGKGTVTSDPTGISCGSDCSEAYDYKSDVKLTATPSTGSTFAGWSGGGCSGTGACTVSMTAATTVTAAFKLSTYTLTVKVDGLGTVKSSPAGISCPKDCSGAYTPGTSVTLEPTPAKGYSFAGWKGDCTGVGKCVVSMTKARGVNATFVQPLTCGAATKVLSCGDDPNIKGVDLPVTTESACQAACQLAIPAQGASSGCWIYKSRVGNGCHCGTGKLVTGGTSPGNTCK